MISADSSPETSGALAVARAARLIRKFRACAAVIALLTALVGLLALAGWLLDLYAIKALFSVWGTTGFTAALGLLLAGASLWLLRKERGAYRVRLAGYIGATLTFLLGLVTLAQYALGRKFDVEGFVPLTTYPADDLSPLALMAPSTAVCFALAGLALLVLDRPLWGRRPAQYLTVVMELIALIAFLEYAYGAESVYAFVSSRKMALPTAMGILLLGLGLLLSRPDKGFMATAISGTPAGVLARRLLPEAVLVLILVSWLSLQGVHAGFYNKEFGLVLLVVVSIVSLISLIAWSARSMRQVELKRARAEDALQKTEERFRLLVEGVRDYAIFMLDPDGRVASWTTAAERMLGYNTQEILGIHFSRFYTHQDLDDGKPNRELNLARLEGKYEVESWLVRSDGSRFWGNIVLTALLDGAGRLRGFGKVVRDITERRFAEERIRSMNLELERRVVERTADLARSNAELEQFAYVAAHDLQEPLRKVISYTQLLQELYKGKLDTDADEFIHYAVDGAERMQRLIQDLLAYSRVGRKGKPPGPIALEEVLKSALGNLHAALEENSAVVTFDPLPTVVAEEALLVHLFQNLIGNAVKFRGKEPPHIHVSGHRRGKEWLFSVQDNGIGIEPQYAEKIFVIFQRLHAREQYPGTGIGLAICKKIVERHGGRIWLDSRPGEGSTFYFTLADTPLRSEEDTGNGREKQSQTDGSLARR